MFLCPDTSLPPFYVLVNVDNLDFATTDTEALTLVKSKLQKRHTCTDLAPPLDESVEPSGPYQELVGFLMYLMTCTRLDLAYPLSLLARYVAPGRLRKVHWDAAKRLLRYLCDTSGMGLVLGGRGPVVLTVHADASWQCGQLRLAYVATRANTADICTKALLPGDHQRFSTVLGLVPTLPHLLTA
ncbi:unnamed protein product [Closterium sp. NIES-53]